MSEACGEMLSVSGLKFGYVNQPEFLGPIDLAISEGECLGIIGPNGAGKSTLLRLIAYLLRPSTGTIAVDGVAVSSIPHRSRAKLMAFVPQNPTNDLDLTVGDIVLLGRFPHRSLGMFESTDDRKTADWAMEISETTPFANRPLRTLSGGEAQRAHIAAALAQKPRLLLLDEPTASLDLKHQLSILDMLREQCRSQQLTLVIVTHDVNLAARYCSRVLLLHDGKQAAFGTPEDVVLSKVLSPVYDVELSDATIAGTSAGRWVVATAAALDSP